MNDQIGTAGDAARIRLEGPRAEQILRWLNGVPDPEVPAISVVELGIVRAILDQPSGVTVVVTPTYSGCPALKVINDAILAKLSEKGINDAKLEQQIAPPWTTDWIDEDAREKLRRYGIAPPCAVDRAASESLVLFPKPKQPVACPFCNSQNTTRRAEFGSTACKAYHFCNACQQPFEEFKPI